jgi:hypothetical protein
MPEEPMTDLELRDAIEQVPRGSERWNALIREACKRTSYPLSWLPVGVSWSERDDHGSSGIKGDGM